jgi:hypothetical protein
MFYYTNNIPEFVFPNKKLSVVLGTVPYTKGISLKICYTSNKTKIGRIINECGKYTYQKYKDRKVFTIAYRKIKNKWYFLKHILHINKIKD